MMRGMMGWGGKELYNNSLRSRRHRLCLEVPLTIFINDWFWVGFSCFSGSFVLGAGGFVD